GLIASFFASPVTKAYGRRPSILLGGVVFLGGAALGGILSASLINYGTQKIDGGWGWRISLAMAAVPASILTLGAIFLPKTPNSLIQQNKDPDIAK
ncbi:hexose carrier protein HEX6, partial [Tanacetum coccineum]